MRREALVGVFLLVLQGNLVGNVGRVVGQEEKEGLVLVGLDETKGGVRQGVGDVVADPHRKAVVLQGGVEVIVDHAVPESEELVETVGEGSVFPRTCQGATCR